MKNLSLILNVVLLVAVIVLYVLYFKGNSNTPKTSLSDTTALADVRVAFVNVDTLNKYYEYLKVNEEKFAAKAKKYEDDYKNRAMGLQNEINNYQRSVNNLTFSQQKALEEDLTRKQQNLQMYQQSLSQQLMQEQAAFNQTLYDRLTRYAKKYGEENGLHMIMQYSPSSDVLWGRSGLDITDAVVKGLNDEFKSEGAAADSTATKK